MPKREEPYTKVLVTLPQSLADELEEYARLAGSRNKSMFVADAIKAFIKPIHQRRRKVEHLLRKRGLSDREIKRVFTLLDNT